MAVSASTSEYSGPSRSWDDLPRGLYYLEEVGKYLRATDRGLWEREVWVSPERILDWVSRGFFGVDRNRFDGDRRYIEFAPLVSLRLMALLESRGVSDDCIAGVHDYVKVTSGDRYPFATRIFWTDESDGAEGLYARFCEVLSASNGDGEVPFARLLNGDGTETFGMEFDSGGRAIRWDPAEGIEIHPGFLSGAPRLKGRRIHADQIAGMLSAGDSRDTLMWWLEVTEAEIDNALRWESRLNEAGLAATA